MISPTVLVARRHTRSRMKQDTVTFVAILIVLPAGLFKNSILRARLKKKAGYVKFVRASSISVIFCRMELFR